MIKKHCKLGEVGKKERKLKAGPPDRRPGLSENVSKGEGHTRGRQNSRAQ